MRSMYGAYLWLLLAVSLVSADQQWTQPIRDFSGGITPNISPAAVASNALLELDNFVIDGNGLRLRKGFVPWGTIAPIATPISALYEFHNTVSGQNQVLALVGDEIYFLSSDSSTAYRIGISYPGQNLVLADNDSIAYATGVQWLKYILPEDGDDWKLYIYTESGTYSFPIYRVLSDNHLKLDNTNTSGQFLNQANFALVPSFDTSNTVQFETWNNVCFISDGVHPVRKWTGSNLDNGHYIVDSAVISDVSYGTAAGLKAVTLSLSVGLVNNAPSGNISEYGQEHYAIVYDLNEDYPYGNQKAIMRMPIVSCTSTTELIVLADLLDYTALAKEQRIWIVPPSLESYSFAYDTILSGVADSIVRYDTNPAWYMVIDTILTQFRDTTLAEDADSVEITLDISYNAVDDYTVIHSYGSDYESRIMVRKVDTDKFRLIRPPIDNAPAQSLYWIAVGIPSDPDSADGETDGNNWLWQWGTGEFRYIYPIVKEEKDTVTLSYTYDAVDAYSVGIGPYSYLYYNPGGDKNGLPYVENFSPTSFYYYDENWILNMYRWVAVGEADVAGQANSDDDSVLVQWGIDTLAIGVYAKNIWLEYPYPNSSVYQVAISTLDTNSGSIRDTIENRILAQAVTSKWFEIKRDFANVAQEVSWVAVGSQQRSYPDTGHVTLVYDHDVLVNDSIYKNEDLFTAPHIFKIVDGPGSEDSWWSQGVPCALHRTDTDSLTLRVIAPAYDYDTNEIDLPPPDSASYIILRLEQYPPVRFTKSDQQRMFFISSADYPNIMWMSDLYEHNTVNTANYQIIGGDDNDVIMALGGMFGQRWIYKRTKTYGQIGNDPDQIETYLRQNKGAGTDALLIPYQSMEIGVNREEFFAFNGTSMPSISGVIENFFRDSINLDELDLTRGAIVADRLLLSYPSSGASEVDRSLLFDFANQTWATSSMIAPAYLRRSSIVGLDSLLIADRDSAKLYAYGSTKDAGAEIVGRIQLPYVDLGGPERKKSLEKILLHCQMDHSASWIVQLYQDDLITPVWQDTITSSLSAAHWQHMSVSLPSLPEFRRMSLALQTLSADTVTLDYVRFRFNEKGESIGQ